VMERRRSSTSRGKKWEGGKYAPRRKVCPFCADKQEVIDYKDPAKLQRYIWSGGRIEPRRKIGTCAKHQRALALAIRRARHLALLPFVPAHVRKVGIASSGE